MTAPDKDSEERLESLSDLTEQAHARVQQAHGEINPVVELRRGMRDAGIPADALSIDCLRTCRRILLILHDSHPDALLYQFTDLEQEAGDSFQQLAFDQVTVDTLFEWMRDYFA